MSFNDMFKIPNDKYQISSRKGGTNHKIQTSKLPVIILISARLKKETFSIQSLLASIFPPRQHQRFAAGWFHWINLSQ
ncbi:hypothetical protein GWO43_29105 [candidate division KSB1 bacterium]|nr:hypothetical protein [candidate division KSB1 bacterium]NIX74526.1 hypothetical protein [candidate division KSB1 bacterium]